MTGSCEFSQPIISELKLKWRQIKHLFNEVHAFWLVKITSLR